MSITSLSPYSTLPDVLKQLTAGFLDFRETVSTLPTVNRAHRDLFSHNLFWIRDVSISARIANELFEKMALKFPRLAGLTIQFHDRADRPVELVAKSQYNTITRLCISILHEKGAQHWRFLQNLLARSPQLTELVIKKAANSAPVFAFTNVYSGCVFAPVPGPSIIGHVKGNLRGLKKLDLGDFPISRPEIVLELLQCSQQFTSVILSKHQVSNPIFEEIAKSSASLTHLDLHLAQGAVDNRILVRCKGLERFNPGANMREEALISLISENPNIIELNLSCSPGLLTDKVLKTIAEKLPKLRSLSLYLEDRGFRDPTQITDEGFLPVVRNCRQLRKLHLGNSILLSSAALLELGNCPFLEDLQYGGYKTTALTNDVFDVIMSLAHLKYLRLRPCQNISEDSLNRLQNLSCLRGLSLEGTGNFNPRTSLNFTNKVLSEMAVKCLELEVLHINSCRKINDKGLLFWLSAPKQPSKLKQIHLIDADISPAGARQFLGQYPRVKAHSFTSIGGSLVEFRDEY